MSLKRVSTLSAAIAPVLMCISSVSALPAFPGAEGFGSEAIGGRNSADVYHVTSLADTLTPGTLRYGLRESGYPVAGRTIVFDVGGTINLTSNLDIKNISNLTIAGQTAPGNGITLTGYTLQVTSSSGKTTSNIVVRHLRGRKGDINNGDDAMGVLGSGSTHTIVLDHVSAYWSEDEALSLTNNSNNVTVQYSFINEGLNGGGHGYASLIRPQINASYSYHHNLVAHHKSRMPRPGSYNGMTTNLDFRNNVLYNWLDGPGYSEDHDPGEFVNMNYVGNVGIAGPNTPLDKVSRLFDGGGLNTKIWQEGNAQDSNKDTTRSFTAATWSAFINEYTQMGSAFAFAPVTTDSAEVAYEKVLLRGGAMPWARDATDARVVNDVRTQDPTGLIKNTQPPAEWTAITTAPSYTRPAGWDTDNDGMPNWWELGRGHNPSAADGSTITPTGYSRLENYLNYVANTSAWGPSQTGNWSNNANWLGGAPNSIDALASFRSIAPEPFASKTIAVDSTQTVGMINFESPFVEYTINGPAGIMLDDASGTAAINLLDGARHAINAPLALADNTSIVVIPAASTLALAGPIMAPGVSVTKLGPGTLELGPIATGGFTVTAGRVKFLAHTSEGVGGADPAPSVVTSLTFAGGSVSPTTSIDLTNNTLIVDPTSGNPINDIRNLLINGYVSGNWTGNGLNSSTAAANANYSLGFGAASALGISEFDGITLDTDAIVIALTRYGDANLDRTINLDDFNRLATSFGTSGKLWTDGDFNFDGTVNLDDFNLLAGNFGLGAGADGVVDPGDWSALAAAIPEPAAGALVGIIFSTMFVRIRNASPETRRTQPARCRAS